MQRPPDLSVFSSLSSLLQNPVRFGPRFLDPDPDWGSLYTPLNPDSRPPPPAPPPAPPGPPAPSTVLFSPDRLVLDWATIRPRPPGLINTGNSCYLNAVLQALAHLPPLVQYLLTGHHSLNCSLPPPSALTRQAASTPQDAHEFLRCLLGEMQRACIAPYSNLDFASQETSVIYRIFGGYLCQQVTCTRGGHVSATYPVYLDLSLDLAGSVEEALGAYVSVERLAGGERYRCEGCGGLVDSDKQSTIYTAPPVLTLHLKRFACTPRPAKLGRHVRYGETLDLSPYMSQGACVESAKERARDRTGGVGGGVRGRSRSPGRRGGGGAVEYRLAAVVVHAGSDTRSGHYYAFCRASNGTWSRFNDDLVCSTPRLSVLTRQVSTVGLHTVLAQQAYLLLYVRTRCRSRGAEGGARRPDRLPGQPCW
ncbi:hypothetical protein PMAC_002403 [Pneumocystis sp. 'macacae']|nr:hypothetical protein PMAC_002403 [Pneumocystis sp. 'macacae']